VELAHGASPISPSIVRGVLPPLPALLALIAAGAAAALAASRRLAPMEPARLARACLVGVTALMGVRAAAYVAANIFGLQAVRPLSTGPYDLTNLLVGGVLGLAAAHVARRGSDAFWREPDLVLALRVATGVAFILAGLVNVYRPDAGATFFIQVGYTKTFRLFILTAEVLGGAALLLPWRWLTLVAAAGLAVDMFGAIYTILRAGGSLDPAALSLLFRLAPLTVLTARGRWVPVAMGAAACAAIAVAGATLLRR
jgi:DoxX-like protein